MKVQGDRIFIEFIDLDPNDGGFARTAGGLLIADEAESVNKPRKARVCFVGNGRLSPEGKRIPIQINPEEIVLIKTGAGVPVEVNGKTYHQVVERDVLGVIEEAP